MHTSLFFLGLLSLCAAPAFGGADQQPLAPAGAPSGARQPDPRTYIIGPEDLLSVKVWREPELSGTVVVRPDGKVSLQLTDEIVASGLTPVELAALLTKAYTNIITHPEVTVAVVEVRSKKIYIYGEVEKPGAYSLAVPTTVLDALANCGTMHEFAHKKKITVLRGKQTFHFNYQEVLQGKKLEQNILLQPGDHIYVP